ncbi:NUDIX hydrolase [Rhizobium sp. RU36D]|uniref:NUDIX hydrolase n=1 Tax=Rhizobium sp. RU36D TaxID=1907415 RepID=UPI0009D8497A|nr:NUDIX hydrolase [Rhizobium sp. RU36D]SMD05822.1 8-oxo-dGTP pyrophosphatase MutT, NUDIX family [Rhizobium sp. RU36D]
MTPNPFEQRPKREAGAVNLRPKDAATLLLVDRSGSSARVLVGRRGGGHVFMPDLFVFPGGRRDRTDSALPFDTDLHPEVLDRLASAGDAASVRRARGIAMAAVRELHEETGLTIGRLEPCEPSSRLCASLSSLRYVARAITPPGNVRRFDTRFFLTFVDEVGVDPASVRSSDELQDLQWVDMDAATALKMPPITRTILDDVKKLMSADPSLPFGSAGPFYYLRHGRLQRGSI